MTLDHIVASPLPPTNPRRTRLTRLEQLWRPAETCRDLFWNVGNLRLEQVKALFLGNFELNLAKKNKRSKTGTLQGHLTSLHCFMYICVEFVLCPFRYALERSIMICLVLELNASSGTVGSPFDFFLVNGLMRAHGKPRLSPAKSCVAKLRLIPSMSEQVSKRLAVIPVDKVA